MPELPQMPNVVVGKRRNGIAGEYAIPVTVTYAGEEPSTVTFVSSVYGAPIVMVTDGFGGRQVFVSDRVLDRIGRTLDAAWCKRFFGAEEEAK